MLTPIQLATLKAAILAETDPTFVSYRTAGANSAMSDWYNEASGPAFVCWKASVPSGQIGKTVNYVAVAAMTTANLERLNNFLGMNPSEFDPGRADIRAFMADTFSGALGGQGQATRDALDAMYRRTVTRGEKIYATGTGTTATPGTLGYEGTISVDDIRAAVAL
jgi:hypothetical protein